MNSEELHEGARRGSAAEESARRRHERLAALWEASELLRSALHGDEEDDDDDDGNGNRNHVVAAAAEAAMDETTSCVVSAIKQWRGYVLMNCADVAAHSDATTSSLVAAMNGFRAAVPAAVAAAAAIARANQQQQEAEAAATGPEGANNGLLGERDDADAAPPGGADNPYLRTQARGFQDGVAVLENPDPIDVLSVSSPVRQGDDQPDEAPFFRRFVDLLGGRDVREICFGDDTDWSQLPDDDTERLFRDVLPNHRTLRKIHLNLLPPRFVRMLTESIPAASVAAERFPRILPGPRELSITEYKYVRDAEAHAVANAEAQGQVVQAVVDMLKRNTVIEGLHLAYRTGRLASDHCRRICDAVPRSTCLRSFAFVGNVEMSANSLDALAQSKLLKSLHVCASFSADAVPALARQLRTNDTLEHLTLRIGDGNDDPFAVLALLELVRTYNYTLKNVDTGYLQSPRVQEQFEKYRFRNQGIRFALRMLQEPGFGNCYAEHPWRLAWLLGRVSSVPTALYKVLKMDFVIDIITAGQSMRGRRLRERNATPTPRLPSSASSTKRVCRRQGE